MILLKGATVFTMADETHFVGDIAIDGEKIARIAECLDAEEYDEVIDLSGKYMMPGIVDAHSHIGMWEDSLDFEGADGNESTDPITPHLRAIDAINPRDKCFKEALEHGVTTVVTGPGSANILGGTFVAMKTYLSEGSCDISEMIIKDPVAMKAAFGENPKKVYVEQKTAPTTRMATAAMLRDALNTALQYLEKLKYADGDLEKIPDYDAKSEALLPVLNREIPLKVHAHRADDIMTALRIAKEFNLLITLDHCTDGHTMLDSLAAADVPIILGPLLCDRGKPELHNLSLTAPRKLRERGMEFALMTDHPVLPEQFLPVAAALAVREGLDEISAMRSITIWAAKAVGLADRVGSIAPGKDADIAVFDAHPLDFRSKTHLVMIDGKIVYQR